MMEAKAAIEAVCGIVQAVGERYRQQKDLLSLVLLYEATQAGVLAGAVCAVFVWSAAPHACRARMQLASTRIHLPAPLRRAGCARGGGPRVCAHDAPAAAGR
jgi:hypothetical protein